MTDKQPVESSILIVDDEPVVHEVILAALDGKHPVRSAHSAAEALALAKATPLIDVALVDKNLPDGSGLGLIPQLQFLHPSMEVLLITAYANLSAALEAMKAGACDFVIKPFQDVGELAIKIRNAADKARLQREQQVLLRELKASERRYRKIFESTSDALVVYETDTGAIVQANGAAARMYGYSPAELCRVNVSELSTGSPDVGDLDDEELTSGPAVEMHVARDGRTFMAEVTRADFLYHKARMTVATIRDVTARAEAEAERRQIEAYTREMHKMEAVGRLAGGICHDFNNLLMVIGGEADALCAQLDPGPLLDAASNIRHCARSGAALTQQLLAFTPSEVVQSSTVDANRVVVDTKRLLERTLGEHVELSTHLTSHPCLVDADAGRLAHVLINLCVNARDAMPAGGKLFIESSHVHLGDDAVQIGVRAGDYVCLQVSDTGCGVAPEVLERIFEPFFTTKRESGGTGLGLSTSYGIIQQYKGSIRVYSEVGLGTTVRVYLPASKKAAPQLAALLPAEAPRGHGEVILVAEDEELVRSLVRRALVENGYEVLVCRNGQEAIDVASRCAGQINLLLTDVVMPKLSGPELAEQLRRSRPQLKILYMSGYANHVVLHHGLGPADGNFLQKPFSRELLLARIHRLLASAPAGGP
jgi:PAS domain S-box-containing protein